MQNRDSDFKLTNDIANDWCLVNFDRADIRLSTVKSTTSTVIEVLP